MEKNSQEQYLTLKPIHNIRKRDFGVDMEEYARSNQKLFYRVLKSIRTRRRQPTNYTRDKEGKHQTNDKDIMELYLCNTGKTRRTSSNRRTNNAILVKISLTKKLIRQ